MDPEQLPLIREVIARAPLTPIAIGSSQPAHAVKLASELDSESVSDLRSAIAGTGVDLVLLAAPHEFGATQEHRELIAEASERGVRFATLEPIPSSAIQLASDGWYERDAMGLGMHAADRVRCLPLIRDSDALSGASEAIASFGAIRAMLVETWSDRAAGSLGARLYGAIELVTTLMGELESVDAAFVAPESSGSLRPLPGETLRDLHGEFTANLRDPSGRAAVIFASDRVHAWRHALTLTGESGRLHLREAGLEWTSPDGRVVESTTNEAPLGGVVARAGESIARAIRTLTDPALRSSPRDHAMILATASAALLSARTGQNESPATIRRMAGLP
jgi:predicted dehydrogenase